MLSQAQLISRAESSRKEAPIDLSNVMYSAKGQAVRVGFSVQDGKKVRVNKKTGEVID